MAMNLHLLHHLQPSFTTKHSYSIPKPSRYFQSISIFSPKTPILNLNNNSFSFGNHALLQDVGATAFVLGGGYTLVSAFDLLTSRNIIPQPKKLKKGERSQRTWLQASSSSSSSSSAGFIIFIIFIRTIEGKAKGTRITCCLSIIYHHGSRKTYYLIVELFLLEQNLSRKLVHIISGLLFVASWPLFSTSTEARYFASLAPLANGLRLVIYGLSLAKDESLIKSVTREGRPEELLRGPLYYVLILAFCALAFWRDSPVGLLSLAMMSGGDGMADIMGRKFGDAKLPYNKKKSWVGSISMFVFGFLVSLGMLYYFSALGYLQLDLSSMAMKFAAVSFIATMVESLPFAMVIDDNISVPLATMVSAYIFFCI